MASLIFPLGHYHPAWYSPGHAGFIVSRDNKKKYLQQQLSAIKAPLSYICTCLLNPMQIENKCVETITWDQIIQPDERGWHCRQDILSEQGTWQKGRETMSNQGNAKRLRYLFCLSKVDWTRWTHTEGNRYWGGTLSKVACNLSHRVLKLLMGWSGGGAGEGRELLPLFIV